jgi:hypothetical protein
MKAITLSILCLAVRGWRSLVYNQGLREFINTVNTHLVSIHRFKSKENVLDAWFG